MNYLTVKEIAAQWEVSTNLVSRYCAENKIPGAKKEKGKWLIPDDAQKPIDGRRKIEEKEPEFTFVDLFCGIGGFHQAMASLGGKCVFACDINELCRKVYEENYKTEGDDLIIASDIKKVAKEKNLPQFDILCGGFPCQTFSKAGKQNGFKVVENENGETDDRGQLFFRIVDILQDHPECNYVVLENVRNLADKKNDWKVVCDELKALGFVITEEPIIESPHKFGIPQVRDRVYILGVKEAAIKTETLREKGKITRDMLDIDSRYEACPKNCIPMLLDEVADPKYYVPGELVEVSDYSFSSKKRQTTVQNTYFNTYFGRSDFEEIDDHLTARTLQYMLKYIEKTGERIVYSRGLYQYFISDIMDDDIVCVTGTNENKFILFDDFSCFDEGVYIGQNSPEVRAQMKKSN